MANLTPPSNPNALANAVLSNASNVGKAVSSPLNQGTTVTLAVANAQQTILATAKGKIELPPLKTNHILKAGAEYVARTTASNQATILEIANKFIEQPIKLNAQQSKQVIAEVAQKPGLIAQPIQAKGKVIATGNDLIKVAIQGQQLSIPVQNANQFRVGQWITFKLTPTATQWKAEIAQEAKPQEKQILQRVQLNENQTKEGISAVLKGQQSIALQSKQAESNPLLKTIFRNDNQIEQISLKPLGKNQVQLALKLSPAALATVEIPKTSLTQVKALAIEAKHLASTTNALDSKVAINKTQESVSQLSSEKSNKSPTYQHPTLNKQQVELAQSPLKQTVVSEKQAPQEIKLSQSSQVEPAKNKTVEQNLGAKAEQVVNPLPRQVSELNRLLKDINIHQNGLPAEVIQKLFTKLNDILARSPQAAQSNQPNAQTIGAQLKQLQQSIQQIASESATSDIKSSLESLIQSLKSPELGAGNEALKQQLQQISKQLVSSDAELANIDPKQIKQLLTGPSLTTTPLSLNTVQPPSHFLSGLMTLVQLSLSARLAKQQPKMAEQLINSLSPLLAATGAGGKKANVTARALRDFSTNEQKSGLLKLASDTLNSHANQKLDQADKAFQGQEAMHYILPFGSESTNKPAELLIKREQQQDQDKSKDKQAQSVWSLTMKLSIGPLGEVLSKAKLNQDSLDIDFYTSSAHLKDLVFNFMPLLKKRFEQLGIEMKIGACEVADIPSSLATKPYQIFEMKV